MNIENIVATDNPILMAVFALLCTMSVLSWYVILWKGLSVKKERAELAAFKKNYAKTADWPLHAAPENLKGGIAVLIKESEKLKPTLAHYAPADRREILGMHLSQSLDRVRTWLDKGLTILASTGSSAPFIGLFGTVWGITGALAKIAKAGNAGLNVVAGPMGEALVATAVGLFAAIPAVLAYNAFVRVNRIYIQDLRHIAEQMTVYLSTTPQAHSADLKLIREKR